MHCTITNFTVQPDKVNELKELYQYLVDHDLKKLRIEKTYLVKKSDNIFSSITFWEDKNGVEEWFESEYYTKSVEMLVSYNHSTVVGYEVIISSD
ncbi:MAG: hypothetical protein ACXAC7_20815 [Candidatus Hodarchaeales archaeon]|jgi:heme-degrading monooxygenase HmoA